MRSACRLAVFVALATVAAAQEPPPCPYPDSPTYPGLPGVCHPYQQPWPQASQQTTTGCPDNCRTLVQTGEGIFPPSNPFDSKTFPGTNFLPTIYTNAFDSAGREIPNTLPSTPSVPYNLHDGDPVVSVIDPLSPEDDLDALIDRILRLTAGDAPEEGYAGEAVQAALRQALDILEGEPVPNRAYSGFPLLHYNGPEKVRKVVPIKDAAGNVIGGNVDVHQVWYNQRIESDTAFLDPSAVANVPWTVTYKVDVLNRGRDDFSPYVMYMDVNGTVKKPGVGMDQSFFNMDEGTRTVFRIKMAPGEYYSLVYTWGWRMHPPRVQVMEGATKTIDYRGTVPPVCPSEYQGLTLPQVEQAVFCQPSNPGCTSVRCRSGEARFTPDGKPMECEQRKLFAISKIGDVEPAKRMWNAFREAQAAAGRGDYRAVADVVRRRARPAYWDSINRNQLPSGLEPDPESDVTLLFANNTTYGELTDGAWGRWDEWSQRPKKLRVTIYNGDNFVHSYTIADLGGNRGWENQFKSSVKFAGSGCWFTFGRNYWWTPAGGPVNTYICVPPAKADGKPGVARVEVELNYDPSRRLRFYQFDPMHHDVAVYSVH
ncbi:MAG TPA: hypothetical protein VMW27_17035 [Thermoanaerobaculia bacterium]|nr:hypothetical protein [Thermoanaerobaculia bacterium]